MYKFKKFWVFIKFQKLKNILNLKKSKKIQLTEIEEFFITCWKEMVYDKTTSLYKRKRGLNDFIEIHDSKGNITVTMLVHSASVRMDYYGEKNKSFIHCDVELPRSIGDRLISAFNSEIEKRCELRHEQIKNNFIKTLNN